MKKILSLILSIIILLPYCNKDNKNETNLKRNNIRDNSNKQIISQKTKIIQDKQISKNETKKYRVIATSLMLRSKPSTNSKIIDKISN